MHKVSQLVMQQLVVILLDHSSTTLQPFAYQGTRMPSLKAMRREGGGKLRTNALAHLGLAVDQAEDTRTGCPPLRNICELVGGL